MQGIKCTLDPRPSKLSGLAIKLKNYMLSPGNFLDNPKQIKKYFRYWKAKDFLEAEPDIVEGKIPLKLEMLEEECKRRGFKTERKSIEVDEKGKILYFYLYIYPFSLCEVLVKTAEYILDSDIIGFHYCDNSNFMPVPENAPLTAVFDIMERLDAHLKERLATEWQAIERRAAKLVKKAELRDIAIKVTGQAEREAQERTELLESTFGKAGFKYRLNDDLTVSLFEDFVMSIRWSKKMDKISVLQLLDVAKQVSKLLAKYEEICRTPRVTISHTCDSAMMEGWSDIRMRLPYKLLMSFEIENAKFAEQFKECNAFATEFVALIDKLREKYGSKALKPTFTRSFEMSYSKRHYLSNKDSV